MHYSRVRFSSKRRLYDFYSYITFKKVFNLILSLIEKQLRITKLKSYPVVLKIDSGPICQLNCPLCKPKHLENNRKFELEENLSKENLEKIIEPLKNHLIWISLSHRGEPFMNPALIELIEYIHTSNIAVSFPTNFSLKLSDSEIEKIGKSGLDKIIVSLDGASEETNAKYRVGSDFDLILSNVNRLSIFKKKQRSSKPRIIWKFIIFEHNKHEINIVKETYKLLGFDSYEFVFNKAGKTAKERKDKYRRKRINTNCYWLWHMMVIQSDGQVNPCCNQKNYNIGNAFESNVLNIWNNKVYQNLRSGFEKEDFPASLHEFCKNCYHVH